METPPVRRNPTPLLVRLRWVMVGAIAFSVILTLCGQPESFWRDPGTAIRGDGLPIHHPTNHTFEFFLGHGPVAFLAANLVYAVFAFVVVSRLPRAAGALAAFSVLFAHGYGATNWLATRYHLGVGPSPALWGVLFGTALSFAILPTTDNPRAIVMGWRWLVVATMFVDFANTLLGQPASYWRDPATLHEGNSLVRLFLGRSWLHYLGLDLALAAGEFALITFLPLSVAFVTAFAFIFGSFAGASNWFFYTWRLGWITPVAYGVLLSALLVATVLRDDRSEANRRRAALTSTHW